MDANRPVHLAAASKQAAQGKVRLDRLGIHLSELQEDVDRLIGLLIQQIIQPTEKGRVPTPTRRARTSATPRDQPSGCGGDRQEKEQKVDHHVRPSIFRQAGAGNDE
jgi:hypothetical protein